MKILYLQYEKVEGVSKRQGFSFSSVLNLAFSNDSISFVNASALTVGADYFFFKSSRIQPGFNRLGKNNLSCLKNSFDPKQTRPFVFLKLNYQ